MKRTLAWIGILIIAAAFAALIFFTATGASANVIMATMFCMIIVPVIIYGFLAFANIQNRKKDSLEKMDEQTTGKKKQEN